VFNPQALSLRVQGEAGGRRMVGGVYNRDVLMPIQIRDFAAEDFETLWRIDQQCFPPEIAYGRAELLHYMNRKTSFGIVAVVDGAIGGFLVAEASKRRKAGHVITIDVLEEFRRHQLGTQLMAECEKRLIEHGCDAVFLETAVNNAAAIAFYRRHHYRVLEALPRYYHGELDALLMGKRLGNL
jgi:[ribosomal protein S18]-alanine N-acetyltransferase